MGRRVSRGGGLLAAGLAALLLAGCNAGLLKDAITGLATLVAWTEAATLDAGAALSAGDRFGQSVAASGDDIVIGCPRDDPGTTNNGGSVHFFHWDGSQWQHQTYDGTVSFQRLGFSVAVSGDFAIAGAPGAITAVAGSARLFKRTAGVWAYVKTLLPTSSPDTMLDEFGTSVAISGDYALVGAPATDAGIVGYAYVFYRNQGSADNWGQQVQMRASDFSLTDDFGASVALSDPYAVVGAPGLEAAYLFERNGSNWGVGALPANETLKLKSSDGISGDLFGSAAAVSGTHALVGAPLGDAAYLFVRNGSAWGSGSSPATESVKLVADDGVAGDQFGAAVALATGWAAVGAYMQDGKAADAGAAYVFAQAEGWNQFDKLLPAGLAAGDQFGFSVGLTPAWLVGGANLDDAGVDLDVGAAYVFQVTERR